MEYVYGALIGAVVLYIGNSVLKFVGKLITKQEVEPKFETLISSLQPRVWQSTELPPIQHSDERHVKFLQELVVGLLERQNVSMVKSLEPVDKKA